MRTSSIIALVMLNWLFQLLVPVAGYGQQSQTLTLDKAVELALANYPAIRVSLAQAAAAREGIGLARTSYLPRTDLLWQENRATRNNFFGLVLPQSVIPAVSGPVLPDQSYQSTFGSAGGFLFSWEPFDFGLRGAQVQSARAQTEQADARVEVTRLDVATNASDAFLRLLATEQAVRAARANVDRMETFAKSVHVLVDNQLRPGADASRADAELAAARIQLIQAQQASETSRVGLGEALGLVDVAVAVDAGPLLEMPPDTSLSAARLESHPLAVEQSAAVEVVRAREHVLDRTYFPRFYFQTSLYGRGTGALLNGKFEGGLNGLFPNVGNWATAISVSFPLLDIFSIRSRRRIEANNEAAEKARHDQTILALKAEDARARVLVDNAVRIAQTTPVEVKAAQEAELRARARYDAQLATVTEVAEAQRLLAQAEIDDAVARLSVWRALLAAGKARGDLKPFLEKVQSTPVRRSK